MALNAFQVAALDGPGSKPAPKPESGLTGADLVEAKAEREADASNKALKTADVQHPTRDSRGAEYAASSQQFRDLLNILLARHPSPRP